MIKLTKSLRSASVARNIRKTSNYSLPQVVFHNQHGSQLLSYFDRKAVPLYGTRFSTYIDKLHNDFEKVCEETLDSLTDFFEKLVESNKELEKADISYSSGVLNIDLGKHGTYVINRQSPNKQIWLSSPLSGPKRYDFFPEDHCWIYKHDSKTLHQLLESEISKILGEKINMCKCAHYRL
ncbi:hypothetical protein JTB14_038280 [Gonioctena quinquepunctata]|nr:hypothetical protein JTB14_038280 [Gonioctena quinquepunctata]